MAANEKLESFLAAQEPAPSDTPTPPAPEPQEPPKPEPQQPEPDKGKAAVATPEPADEPDDDDAPEARPGEPAVPRNALIDERNKRRDWKAKAVAAEAKLEEYTKRLEALEKQRQAPPSQPQQQQPAAQQFQFTPWEVDPVRRQQEEVVNLKFEQSEQFARHKFGDEAVDQLINDFAELTAQNPVLRMQLFQQRDPFGWAHKEVERQRLLREVGDDPTSYEQKLRAKWEAEMAAKAPPQVALPQNTPPPAMPPSLAGVRSAAPRAAPQWSGPLSDQQIAADMRERRMAGRR